MSGRSKRLDLFADRDPRFPVQAFFNAIGDADFVKVMSLLLARNGCVINDVGCLFPVDLDPGDAPFEGVRFHLFEDEVTISEAEFLDYVKMVCEAHFVRHSGDAAQLVPLISSFEAQGSGGPSFNPNG